tara:strand:- start:226 stop:531 length:306 start_codon:yes stop_codon:yes gene_type:complete
MSENVSFSNTKIKLVERSRGRMKIQIKFSKEEAEGFKNFCMIKPPEVEDEVFYKQIFFAGCNAMTEQITALVEAHKEAKENEEAEEKTEAPSEVENAENQE